MCWLSLPRHRLPQFKPIRELYVFQGVRKRTPKNSENKSIRNNIYEIWNNICFVCAATFFGKEFWARRWFKLQIIWWRRDCDKFFFSNCLTIKLSHRKNKTTFPQAHLWKSSIPITKKPVRLSQICTTLTVWLRKLLNPIPHGPEKFWWTWGGGGADPVRTK